MLQVICIFFCTFLGSEKKFTDNHATDILWNYYINRLFTFSDFLRFPDNFQVFNDRIIGMIVSFLCCVYLIFLRDFSAEVRGGRGGAYCYVSRYGPHAAVIYVISEVFFGSIRLRTICTRSSRRESIVNDRSRMVFLRVRCKFALK